MKADTAISNVKDPLHGRFVPNYKTYSSLVKIGTAVNTEHRVDFVIQRNGGPYIRVRMDVEGAHEIASDMKRAADRAAAKAPSGAYRPFLVCKVWFNPVEGALYSEVLCGADDEDAANIMRDNAEQDAGGNDARHMFVVVAGGVP